MAAVEMKDKKKEMIEKTAQEFQKLNGDNQMFILGYMLGIQQERQRTTPVSYTHLDVYKRQQPPPFVIRLNKNEGLESRRRGGSDGENFNCRG